MANWLKSKEDGEFRICIPTFKVEDYYAEFEVCVKFLQGFEWRVYRRYTEFKKLNEDLIKTGTIHNVNFPPKKSFNNKSHVFLYQRKESLEQYLNNVVSQCNNFLPQSLVFFLGMDKYEIHGITTAMAKIFFEHGKIVLRDNHVFEMPVQRINAINQRMVSAMPTNPYGKTNFDFGNVLEVVELLQRVKIVPTSIDSDSSDKICVTGNLMMSTLTFDISIFSSVTHLQLINVNISNLRGLHRMNNTVVGLCVQYCLKSIQELLFSDFDHQETSIKNLQQLDGPLRYIRYVNLSYNDISDIDMSIVTLRQVQTLILSHNRISHIDYMQHLTFLTELDLSNNKLHLSQTDSLATKLGSIKKLLLSGNKITTLTIVDRMFSLEHLDVSHNLLSSACSLLSLCRLSCLEYLSIGHNPICSHPNFPIVIFDIFLDRCNNVQIKADSYLTVPGNLNEYRADMKSSLFAGNLSMCSLSDLAIHSSQDNLTTLSSIDVPSCQYDPSTITNDTFLGINNVYNMLIYWFFLATGKNINPKKLLWVTETFPPNRTIRCSQILLVTSGTHSPNMLKCRVVKWFDSVTKSYDISIHVENFIDLSTDIQHVIVGANKSFLRVDISPTNRNLFLCNNSVAFDAFLCRLYRINEDCVGYDDSRIVRLNEEDRLEMMRRFVHVWRTEMVDSMKRNCDNVQIHIGVDNEFLFLSRVMLEMKNGFQILLTAAVTQDTLFLVDERIYDWPDFNKQPNLSDKSSVNNCSSYTSSSGPFPFLRTNAYFLCQIVVCAEMTAAVGNADIVDLLCPTFRYPVKITFNSSHQTVKDPLKLLFENEQNASELCRIIHQQCENIHPVAVPCENVPHSQSRQCLSDLPAHFQHLNSSYNEFRPSLSSSCPQLSSLAQLPPENVFLFMCTDTCNDKCLGIIWSKFIIMNNAMASEENPCILYMSSAGIHVLYEIEDDANCEYQFPSDPEVDQPESNGEVTKLERVFISASDVLKVYVGINRQWLIVCYRSAEDVSESGRLVIIPRNREHCKHMIDWIKAMIEDQSHDESFERASIVDYSHQGNDTTELLCEIQRTSRCPDIDLVHYCSVEHVRFQPAMACQVLKKSCNGMYSNAVVVTTHNIAIVRHNICEYPIREMAPDTLRESPSNWQYQLLIVVPLSDCLELQLPGHDRSILIIIIKSKATTVKIQLTIGCQKEQKHLIDKLRQQRSACLQTDIPIPVNVC